MIADKGPLSGRIQSNPMRVTATGQLDSGQDFRQRDWRLGILNNRQENLQFGHALGGCWHIFLAKTEEERKK
jgi:hypothetical protein